MSYLKVKNRAESTLASGITDVATSLTVATGEGANFPTASFNITIDDEILFCSSRSTDVLTVVREQEGTTGVAHDADAVIELRITAGIIENLERGCGQINVETLSADKTLTPGTDEMYQYLDEGGANRIITLATAGASAGDRFVIRHNGSYNDTSYLQVKQSTIILDYIYAGAIKHFIFDGTNWVSGEIGSGENDNKKNNIAIGYYARGYNYGIGIGHSSRGHYYGIGIGYQADGYSYGVAIGYYAKGSTHGVGIGNQADGESYGVALGDETNTNLKKYSVALGYYSETERYSEIAHCIDGSSTQDYNFSIAGWAIQTANATPVEMFLGEYANQRFTINPESAVNFVIRITARDNVANEVASYKIEGLIKRDGAGNTVLVWSNKTVQYEDDASWDVAVTADDTNEALIITVTGDATNPVRWAARIDETECQF